MRCTSLDINFFLHLSNYFLGYIHDIVITLLRPDSKNGINFKLFFRNIRKNSLVLPNMAKQSLRIVIILNKVSE